MFAEERRQHILEILERKKRADVAELADRLETSPETIRRDLREMAANGFLQRTHGGAIYLANRKCRPQLPFESRKAINHEKKLRIAKRAAGFVEEGDLIALDNSSTVLNMLQFIPRRYKLTLLTYSIPAQWEFLAMDDCEWTCVSLGGIVRRGSSSTHGLPAANALGFFQPRKLFMSCAGVDPAGLITEGDLIETEIKRALIQCSQRKYLLVDETKWGQTGSVNEGNLSGMDCLITNSTVDPALLEFLRGTKVEIFFDTD